MIIKALFFNDQGEYITGFYCDYHPGETTINEKSASREEFLQQLDVIEWEKYDIITYRKREQIKLIMECRQSGLSDYQWCRTKGINLGTFYNWVSKLKKSGYTFPESKSKTTAVPTKQDVVKLDLIGRGMTHRTGTR